MTALITVGVLEAIALLIILFVFLVLYLEWKTANEELDSREAALRKREDEEDGGPLVGRLTALGLACSGAIPSFLAAKMDKAALPSCSTADDKDEGVVCSHCGYCDLRNVLADTSKLFEGHLGVYCFTCGYGKCTHHLLDRNDPKLSNLFLILPDWEKAHAEAAKEKPAVPVDAAPPSATQAAV